MICAILMLSCGATVETTGSNTKSLSAHKNIAILPFEIYLGPKLQHIENFSDSEKQELQRYMSLVLQQHLYETLKKKQKRFPFSVIIQSAEMTNYLLSAKKVSFAQVFGDDKTAICKILGVDAVIFTQTILGKGEHSNLNDMLNRGTIASHFSIYDSIASRPIWSYTKELSANVLTKNNVIVDMPKNMPEAYYKAENKCQKVLIPWIPAVDETFENLAADIPYKKK